MSFPFQLERLAVILLAVFTCCQVHGNDVASGKWAAAMGWVQTGRNLQEAEQWPLALATMIEALRQLRDVAEEFPDFETELIQFRIDNLQSEVLEMQNKLISGDHDVMMSYLDFIESLELGQELRFSDKLEEALTTLEFAKTILDGILADRPEEFRAAVDTQYRRLSSHLSWLDSQVNRKPLPPVVIEVMEDNLGTTAFIKESDLPADPMVAMTNLLFPNGLLPEITPDMIRQLPPELVPDEAPRELPEPKPKPMRDLPPELTKSDGEESSGIESRLPKSLGPRPKKTETESKE